jgi:hypothetical protein
MNLFALSVPIYILEDENFSLVAEADRDNLIDTIINVCKNDDEIDHLFITGPEADMIKEELENYSVKNYNFNNIRIEVNKNV